MGMNFKDIEPKTPLLLHIYKEDKQLNLRIHIDKFLDDTMAAVTLEYYGEQVLNFNNVIIDLEFGLEQAAPYMWKNVRVIHHKGHYILKVNAPDGIKTNRRDSFRVSVGVTGRCDKQGLSSVIVRDISHSGFALTVKKEHSKLTLGEIVAVTFNDMTFRIRLEGELVRIEDREDCTIYGFKSTAYCPTLPNYLAMKQRPAGGRVIKGF